MKKNFKIYIFGAVVVAVVALVAKMYFTVEVPPEVKREESFTQALTPTMQGFVAQKTKEAKAKGEKVDPVALREQAFREYVGTNPVAAGLNELGRQVFGEGPQAQAAADWISLTLMMEDSPDYSQQFESFLRNVNMNPAVVLDGIEKNRELVLKEPFFHQMAINLVHKLSIPRSEKIRLFLNELKRPIEFKGENLTPSSMNTLMAIDFLRTYNATIKEIEPELKKALSNYRPNSKEYFEMRMRLIASFPGLEKI